MVPPITPRPLSASGGRATALGPQAYLTGSRIKLGPIFDAMASTSTAALPRPASPQLSLPQSPWEQSQEKLRSARNHAGAELLRKMEESQDSAAHAHANASRQLAMAGERREEKERQQRAALMRTGRPSSAPVGSPRTRMGAREARAVAPREVTAAYMPVAAANRAYRAEVAAAERAHKKGSAALARALAEAERANIRERVSHELQLEGQARNQAVRRDVREAQLLQSEKISQSMHASMHATEHQRRHTSATLRQKIEQQREKAIEAQERAWDARVHWSGVRPASARGRADSGSPVRSSASQAISPPRSPRSRPSPRAALPLYRRPALIVPAPLRRE